MAREPRRAERYMEGPAGERLAFFTRMWEAQDGAAAEAAEWEPPEREILAEALRSGRAVFEVSGPPVPLEPYRELVGRIARLLAEEGGIRDDAASALLGMDLAAAIESKDLSVAAARPGDLATAVRGRLDPDPLEKVGAATVDFVLGSALTPFLQAGAEKAMERLGEFDWTLWGAGECPACGSAAAAARIPDEGELQAKPRLLWCSVCRTEWPFERLRCARCGSREHEQLRYLYDETDPGHRVHVCEACRGYMKVVFERDLGYVTEPQVEEVVMLPLDVMVAERGYGRR